MNRTMLAWIPDTTSPARIRLAEVPVPRPGPDQVLIKARSFSINRGETFLLEAPPSNWRPGKDVAGEIVELGTSVSKARLGQRVVAHPDQAGWAEMVAVETSRVARLPDEVDNFAAAAIPLAGLTALRLTRATGPLAARCVLLTGASGGVGHAFVQLAAAHGAKVTAVCADAERGARLLELGAFETITQLTAAAGPFDIVLESTGGPALALAWERLRFDGRLVWFGQASRQPVSLDFFNWAGGRSAVLRKFHYLDDETPIGVDMEALVRLVAQKRLHIEIGKIVSWRNAPIAIESLLARRVRGNVVLSVND